MYMLVTDEYTLCDTCLLQLYSVTKRLVCGFCDMPVRGSKPFCDDPKRIGEGAVRYS